MLCVWCDQRGIVYYELLKPGETVAAQLYQQHLIKLHNALVEKGLVYQVRHDKVIFLHNNAPSGTSLLIKDYLNSLN